MSGATAVIIRPLVLLVFAASVVLAAMLACDELVGLERELDPEQWTADGMPVPMLRRSAAIPPTLPGIFATTRCCLVWTLSTPEWAAANQRANGLLWRIRLLLMVWTLVAVPLLVLTSFSALTTS